jgi:hypothetical protein
MNYGHSEFGYVAHPFIRDSETLSVSGLSQRFHSRISWLSS